MITYDSFADALVATGRAAEIPEEHDVYGWLSGRWEMDLTFHPPEGKIRRTKGEIYFAWVLEGRAIQDVWISPSDQERNVAAAKMGDFYGSTLRVYDPANRCWKITWINPLTGAHEEMTGMRNGEEILQLGTTEGGDQLRWRFVDIAGDRFTWRGERRKTDHEEWVLQAEFHARRVRG